MSTPSADASAAASDAETTLSQPLGILGPLAEKMGIQFLEISAERAVGTMPVLGNTQPFGVVHGGAYVVLAESLGSNAAFAWAEEGSIVMGIEVNASHTGSASKGTVTGVCTAIKLGRTLTVHEVVLSDDAGRRLSTVRITNLIREGLKATS